MKSYTGKQSAHLRKLAHHLEPVVRIGSKGLNENIRKTIDRALTDHELIKIKFVDFKDECRDISERLASDTECHLAGVIGNTAVLYREHPEAEKRKIKVPE